MSVVTINLTPQLYDYFLNQSLREHPVLTQLRTETQQIPQGYMQISPEQGQFMGLLMELLGAKKTLDIGTFTGYSALAVALALPADGKVITCDVSKAWTTLAEPYWLAAGVADKIDLRIGPALDTLNALIANGEANTFDFAFIDADKKHNRDYYEAALTLLRPGGLIGIDNVLFSGRVADPINQEDTTQIIRAFNEWVHGDKRVTMSMLPIGDGLTLARKR